MRRFELSQDGGCRRCVRRRDDGAEHDGWSPGHFGHQHPHHDSDGYRRQSHRNDDKTGHWRPVVAKIARRRVVRRVEQDGRDKQRQRQLRQNGKRRRAGNERQERSTDRKKGWIWRADTARDRRQQSGGENQADENLELVHGERAKGDSSLWRN